MEATTYEDVTPVSSPLPPPPPPPSPIPQEVKQLEDVLAYIKKLQSENENKTVDHSEEKEPQIKYFSKIFAVLTFSYRKYDPYEFTLATTTSYVSGFCNNNFKLKNQLLNFIIEMRITDLCILGMYDLKHFFLGKIPNLNIIGERFHEYRKCECCYRNGCSALKASCFLSYKYKNQFHIPCIH